MDIKTYMTKLGSPERRHEFAERAGTSVGTLNNLMYCDKQVRSFEFLVRLVEASNGELSIRKLRPDLFPKGRVGARRARLIANDLLRTTVTPVKAR